MANISIPLGISIASRSSLKRLRRQARARAELVAANQPELAFLKDTDFPDSMPLLCVNDSYVLEGPIPPAQDDALFKADGRANLRRGDDAEAQLIESVLAAVQQSSALVEKVAGLMATSCDIRANIKKLEQNTGVDTKWARHFIYRKQQAFEVMVDDEGVTFHSHAVRAIAPRGEPVRLLLTQPVPKREGMQIQGRVDATAGDNRDVGVQKGGVHHFRVGILEPWQAALVDCARHLQLPIVATAGEADTTCGLREAVVELQEIHNWPGLLESTLAALGVAAQHLVETAHTASAANNQKFGT